MLDQKGILNGKTLELDSVEQIKIYESVITNSKKEVVGVEQSLISLDAQYNAKKKFIAEADKISDISIMYPDYAKSKTQRFTKKINSHCSERRMGTQTYLRKRKRHTQKSY